MSAHPQPTKPAPAESPAPLRAERTAGGAGLTPGVGREAKRRAAAVLEVLAGARTPAQAAAALGLSLPCYYQLESRAVHGLLAGCAPRPKGRMPSAAGELARLRQERQRLERELARQQALVRLTQRAAGLPAAAPPSKLKGKRRRKPTARAVPLAARLRKEAETEERAADGAASCERFVPRPAPPRGPRDCRPTRGAGRGVEGHAMRGRHPSGPEYVDHLDGSAPAKERLKVVLEVLAGRCRVVEACARLGLSEPRFHQLRAELLQAALERLEPRSLGRPPVARPVASPEQVEGLQARVAELEVELHASPVREEIALILPRVVRDEAGGATKKVRRRRNRKRRRPSPNPKR